MDPLRSAVYALVAGLAVVAATTLARRVGGNAGGVMAASPITPTLTLLYLGPAVPATVLLPGIATVTAAMAAILSMTLLAPRTPRAAFAIGMAILLGTPLALAWAPPVLLVAGAIGVAFVIRRQDRSHDAPARGKGLPTWARFLIGAGAMALVTIAVHVAPSLTSIAAMAPLVFAASLVAAAFDGGARHAVHVGRGAVGGGLGVAAFAVAFAATHSLMTAWFAFAAVAAIWQAGPMDMAPLPHHAALATSPRYLTPDDQK